MSPTWVAPLSLAEGRRRARALFEERFDHAPDGVWSAPGRVNIIGEHTDYNDGLALPIALEHRTFAAIALRDDDLVRLVSAQETGPIREVRLSEVGPGTVEGWPGYVVGVAWALRRDGVTVPGFDLAIDSCVPYGAGLSSSAALEAAVAIGLDDLLRLGHARDDAGRARLAAYCVQAENEIAGAPTGGMDQAASLRAREGAALLLDCRDGAVRHVPFDLTSRDRALLVVDTRAAHALVDGQYAARRASCEAASTRLGVDSLRMVADDPAGPAAALERLDDGRPEGAVQVRRVRHVVGEIDRVRRAVAVLDAGGLDEVGPLMDASHDSLRDDYEVSCLELDVAVEAARAAGAVGARMTGGGFGGSAIALVAADRVEHVAAAVADAFDVRGLRPPVFLVARAGAPAG